MRARHDVITSEITWTTQCAAHTRLIQLDDSTPGVLQESISSHPSRLRGTEGPLLHEVWWAIVSSFPTILPVPTITCAEEFDHMRASSGCRSGVALGISLVSCLGAAYGPVTAGDGVARMPRTQGRCTGALCESLLSPVTVPSRGGLHPRCD
jgi:hypothetical protein